jgi:hypothetical protein
MPCEATVSPSFASKQHDHDRHERSGASMPTDPSERAEPRRNGWRRRALCLLLPALLLAPHAAAAQSAREARPPRIENGVAVFAGLDKVTARIAKLEIKLGETRRFGALEVTPRACFSRPPTEPPWTSTFVEVDEIMLAGNRQRIFSGWMFAESPGLNAVEHPVFDVWLTGCEQPTSRREARKESNDATEEPPPLRRPRPRR